MKIDLHPHERRPLPIHESISLRRFVLEHMFHAVTLGLMTPFRPIPTNTQVGHQDRKGREKPTNRQAHRFWHSSPQYNDFRHPVQRKRYVGSHAKSDRTHLNPLHPTAVRPIASSLSVLTSSRSSASVSPARVARLSHHSSSLGPAGESSAVGDDRKSRVFR